MSEERKSKVGAYYIPALLLSAADAGGCRHSYNGNVQKAYPVYQCALKARIRLSVSGCWLRGVVDSISEHK